MMYDRLPADTRVVRGDGMMYDGLPADTRVVRGVCGDGMMYDGLPADTRNMLVWCCAMPDLSNGDETLASA